MTKSQLDTTIHPIDFRGASFLQFDDTQTPDDAFVQEVQDTLTICEDIQEELVGLSDINFRAENDIPYLEIDGGRYYFPETGIAFSQYSSVLGIPFNLAKKNPVDLNQQLFQTHTALKTQKSEKQLLIKYRYDTNSQQNELCAVLRGTFQTIKNKFIFDTVSDALGGHVIVDRKMTNIDPFGQCYLRLLSPNFLPTSNDDKIFLAYDLQFSECIDTGVTLGLGLWRQICSNGMAIPSMEGQEAYRHPYKGLDETVPAYILSRLLKEVVGNDAIGRRLAQRRDDLMVEQMDLQTSFERLAFNKAPGAWIDSMAEKVVQDDTKSQWDLLNILTQEVQSITNLPKRRKIEKTIGMTFGFTLAYDTPSKRKKSESVDETPTLITQN